jgi:dTDP-4-amino-4,6-dideoxygalactose transaminase
VTVVAPGINGKMNEVQAAFGLLQLGSIEQAIDKRRAVDHRYRAALSRVAGIHCVQDSGETTANFAYFPILVRPEFPVSRDTVYQRLKDNGVFARRYFYPLITDFPMYRSLPSAAPANLPVATRVAQQVICLPIYPHLPLNDVDRVVQIIASS